MIAEPVIAGLLQHSNRLRWRLALGVSSALVLLLLAGRVAPDDEADDDQVTDEQIAALVEDLVSPNEPPQTDGPDAEYPANYNRAAQKRVSRAFHKLRDLAPRSFPFLFDSLQDKRYSLTADSGDVDRNYTVGVLCRDILSIYLQSDVWGHKPGGTSYRTRPKAPDYLAHYDLFQPEKAKEWWRTRQDKTIRELQLEVLEWVVDEEAKAPEKYSAEERARARQVLADLRRSKKPLEPGYPFSR